MHNCLIRFATCELALIALIDNNFCIPFHGRSWRITLRPKCSLRALLARKQRYRQCTPSPQPPHHLPPNYQNQQPPFNIPPQPMLAMPPGVLLWFANYWRQRGAYEETVRRNQQQPSPSKVPPGCVVVAEEIPNTPPQQSQQTHPSLNQPGLTNVD
ncbi:hypothetical protein Pelo_5029 [Pelomyxa schiedti]|nr:hypothetical protein Pelo_5029 [Pelomyxa schiedti]